MNSYGRSVASSSVRHPKAPQPLDMHQAVACTRTIADLESPQDILRAISDVMKVSIETYQRSFQVHGGISPNTILIGAGGHATLLAAGPSHPVNYFFQSVESLARLHGISNTASNYLDDFESFYYVLLWMCFEAASPTRVLPWFKGDSLACRRAKESLLYSGIKFQQYHVPLNWGGDDFEALLDRFHFIIKRRRQLGPNRTANSLFTDAIDDYRGILDMIDCVLTIWGKRRQTTAERRS